MFEEFFSYFIISLVPEVFYNFFSRYKFSKKLRLFVFQNAISEFEFHNLIRYYNHILNKKTNFDSDEELNYFYKHNKVLLKKYSKINYKNFNFIINEFSDLSDNNDLIFSKTLLYELSNLNYFPNVFKESLRH